MADVVRASERERETHARERRERKRGAREREARENERRERLEGRQDKRDARSQARQLQMITLVKSDLRFAGVGPAGGGPEAPRCHAPLV